MVSDFYNNFGTRSRIIFGDKIKLKKRTKKKKTFAKFIAKMPNPNPTTLGVTKTSSNIGTQSLDKKGFLNT